MSVFKSRSLTVHKTLLVSFQCLEKILKKTDFLFLTLLICVFLLFPSTGLINVKSLLESVSGFFKKIFLSS